MALPGTAHRTCGIIRTRSTGLTLKFQFPQSIFPMLSSVVERLRKLTCCYSNYLLLRLPTLHFTDISVGVPRWLRNSPAVTDGKRQPHCQVERHPMSPRHIHRSYACPCPKHGPNRFLSILQWCPCALLIAKRTVRANQKAFCAPDRRAVQYYPQMTRQPHPPRVRISLPVAKQQIRYCLQLR